VGPLKIMNNNNKFDSTGSEEEEDYDEKTLE
jgi:hypothetical protein